MSEREIVSVTKVRAEVKLTTIPPGSTPEAFGAIIDSLVKQAQIEAAQIAPGLGEAQAEPALPEDPLAALLDAPEASPELDAFDELEAFLVESEDSKVLAARIKADRKRLYDGTGLTPSQREALRIDILRWESEFEWRPQEFVAITQGEICECGQGFSHFVGFYQLQQHRKSPTARRLVRWEPQLIAGEAAALPRTFIDNVVKVPVCVYCMAGQGFSSLSTGAELWQL